MNIYDVVWQNKEIFKLIYTIIVGLICFTIVLRTNRLFKLSMHRGIRYFRNAFFFYGLAFIMRYILGLASFIGNFNELYPFIIKGVFEFFLIMAGFSLVYSLLWKKFEPVKGFHSSLFNLRMFLLYLLAIVIVILDYLWKTYFFMFLLQVVLFTFASLISLFKYKTSKEKGLLKLYVIVIFLNLLAWITNFLVATFFEWHKGGVIGLYVLNIIIFILLLYGVMNVTKKGL